MRRLRKRQPRAQGFLQGTKLGLQAGGTTAPCGPRGALPPPPPAHPPHSRPRVACDLLDDLAVNLIPEVLLLPAQLWGQEGQGEVYRVVERGMASKRMTSLKSEILLVALG